MVDFKSANPFSFYHILIELEEQEEQDAYGILRMPEQHNPAIPVPLVMGVKLMNIFDIPMITPLRQKLSLAWCADRGTTIGGNPKAREASFKFAADFMKEHLVD